MRDAEEAFSRKTRAAMTPPGPIETPEETGIRASEVDVGTREARAQDSDELAAQTQAGGADATRAAVGGDATQVGGADATRAAGPGTDGTQVAGAGGATVAAGAGATRMGAAPDAAATAPLPATGFPPRQGTAARAPARVSPGLIAALAAAVVVLGVVGYLVGSSGKKSTETPANNSSASAGALTITFPDTWQRVDSAPPIPGLTFKDPISLAPKGGPAVGALTAGTVTASDASLLPATFKKQLSGGAPKGDPVQLGSLKAYRYTGLKPNNYPQQLTVYTVPTDSGVAAVACSATAAQAATVLPECERAASTLTLSGAKGVDLGVPAGYSKALNAAIQRLQAERAAALKKLKAAKTPGPAGQRGAPGGRRVRRRGQDARVPERRPAGRRRQHGDHRRAAPGRRRLHADGGGRRGERLGQVQDRRLPGEKGRRRAPEGAQGPQPDRLSRGLSCHVERGPDRSGAFAIFARPMANPYIKQYLMTAGPTPLPPAVSQVQAEPILYHRAPAFIEVYARCLDRLKGVVQTENEVLCFASSGSGGMESAVANLAGAGPALVASCGKFGERWVELNAAFGADFHHLDAGWGNKVEPAELERALGEHAGHEGRLHDAVGDLDRRRQRRAGAGRGRARGRARSSWSTRCPASARCRARRTSGTST